MKFKNLLTRVVHTKELKLIHFHRKGFEYKSFNASKNAPRRGGANDFFSCLTCEENV